VKGINLILGVAVLALVPLAGVRFVSGPTSFAQRGAVPERTLKQRLAALPKAVTPRIVETYGRLPLRFDANQGHTDSQVKFLSRGSGYTLFLTGNEAVLALQSRQPSVVNPFWQEAIGNGPRGRGEVARSLLTACRLLFSKPESLIPIPDSPAPERPAPTVVRLKLLGANRKAEVTGLDELPGKSSYFMGSDPKKWRTNVPNYGKVKYESVYPGVDLVYYGNQGRLEYDFIVAPGADPRAITLAIEAPDSRSQARQSEIPNPRSRIAPPVRLDAKGDLAIATDAGEVRFHKPSIYQPTPDAGHGTPRRFVDGHYVLLADNRLSFEVHA